MNVSSPRRVVSAGRRAGRWLLLLVACCAAAGCAGFWSGDGDEAAATRREYNGVYRGKHLDRIAFPMGGIGAGMVCLEGTGALSHVSIRNKPDVFNEPCVFAAVCVKGGSADGASNIARVLEGPLPTWKIFGTPESGNGGRGKTYGLPRFARAEFIARFPFATVTLSDDDLPVRVEITGWSPFQPGDADASSLPVAALEYRLANTSSEPVEAVFSFNARNFLASGPDGHGVRGIPRGFVLFEEGSAETPWEQTAFCAQVSNAAAKVNCAWFRGGWFDPLTIAWKDIAEGACFDREPVTEGGASPGGTIFVPLAIAPGETATVPLRISWYCGASDVRRGKDIPGDPASSGPGNHEPWYSGRFGSVDEVNHFWKTSYDELHEKSVRFRDCFYDTTLPPEVVEAVAANLTILKSPTVMRQQDGRLWCWEGCCDAWGCCHGSCTHVWNYAQAIPHLFPELERTLRETEFEVSQDERGHQAFRTALPIRPTAHDFHAAADGQLGGILKVHRDWRISGDTDWMRRLWPRVKASLEYCIAVWDPKHKGILEEPHHNTYDIEFWGPDGMCSSFYLGALRAADLMGTALGDDTSLYRELLSKGARYLETELYDGEYFIQKIQVDGLEAKSPLEFESFGGKYSPEAVDLLRKEGPKYQYGTGCLSDGVIGAWMAAVCGAGSILDEEKVTSHLLAVHRYNLKRDLSDHVNPQRPTFACGSDGGLLLCTWPNGGKLSLPFVYSDEVWTGIEYQVASHLLLRRRIDEGLEIVRVCRDRYDGRIRNPFNEYECGHWYARALASYALLEGLSGARYDAVEKKLHLEPRIAGDFRAFLSTATGYGTVGVKDGAPFVDVKAGAIDVKAIEYTPAK